MLREKMFEVRKFQEFPVSSLGYNVNQDCVCVCRERRLSSQSLCTGERG